MNQPVVKQINVIIVDDHDMFRNGMRMVVQYGHPDIVIVGEAKYGSDFFRLLETAECAAADIVLLDIALPDMSGIEIARRLKTERPALKILAISAINTSSTVEAMRHIGIEGFVSKFNCSNEIIIEAIRAVMQGHEYFGSDISDIISRIYVSKKKQVQVTSGFPEQENRILEYCHEGLPAKLIADRLHISANTVQWHKANIFRKLGINSTLELVQYGVKSGIIQVENG
jgi:DNA-binding NarL/FixJ family response regulator